MRVGFNALFLGQEATGSGQYTGQLLHALTQLDQRDEYLLYTLQEPGSFGNLTYGHAYSQVLRTPFFRRFKNLNKLWFEQIAFPQACLRAALDLAHVPYFASPLCPTVPTVVTVHDLIPLLLPEYRGTVLVRLYMHLVAAAARRARLIITDSLASRKDIIKLLGVPAEQVHVIYLAAHPACLPVTNRKALATVRQRYDLPDRYILYLGGFDQRKNLGALLRAYHRTSAILERETPPLVIAGGLPAVDTPMFPDPRRLASELGISRRVIFTGWVEEQDKPALYTGALFFTFLSLYEGFGLMPLEAMSCGTPVLASRTSSLPEVVGDGGLLVDPEDINETTDGMITLLSDPQLREQLAENALAQAAEFDWKRTADQTLKVYAAAVADQGQGLTSECFD